MVCICFNPLLASPWSHQIRFKLHLQPQVSTGKQLSNSILPLPLDKTVIKVFANVLAYLLECASSYIQDNKANKEKLWESIKDHMYFILSHLNE